jgi:predicted deacylase
MTTESRRIRDIVAARGEVARGYLTIGETPTAQIQIPLVIIHGVRPGPTLCLTGGVHAAEYPAIDAVMRTIQLLDPAMLSGTVIAVPVVSMQMFQNRSGFLSPIDGLNLNRTAPGRADGTISEILVHTLLTEVISQAQYHIDCHGGDLGEILWPYAGFSLTGNAEIDREGETLARLYTPRIFALYGAHGTLPPTSGSVTHTAAHRGVVSMLAEAGSNGTLDPADTQVHLNGIRNVMRYLGMIEGQPVIEGDRLQAREQFTVNAMHGGLVRLKIEIGESLRTGQEVAEIVNVFGDVVEQVTAPRDGIARLIWAAKAVNTGDPIVKCWVTEPAPPFSLSDVNRRGHASMSQGG